MAQQQGPRKQLQSQHEAVPAPAEAATRPSPLRPRPSRSEANRAGAAPESLPEIPDKLYFRIGEVARLCRVAAYVLRFWETEFPMLRPNKGGTGQRLFRRRDVETAVRIRRLLYDEGYTISGARQLLRSEARQRETPPQLSLPEEAETTRARSARLHALRSDLQELLTLLGGDTVPTPAARPPRPRRLRRPAAEIPISLFPTPAEDDLEHTPPAP